MSNNYPEHYDREDKEHAEWWVEEMENVKAIKNTLQDQIARNGFVSIAGSHTSVDKSGEHELRISLKVDGKSLEDFSLKDATGDNQ